MARRSPSARPWMLGLLALAAAACSNPEQPTAPPGQASPDADEGPVDGDALVVGIPYDPGTINPVVVPFSLSQMIAELVQPGLVRRHVDGGELVYQPVLAEDWSFSEDGLGLTYTLREGLAWEDGEPLTSADVAFTWSLITDRDVGSTWHDTARFVAGIDTPDERTVIWHFEEPMNADLLQGHTVRGILPEHALSEVDPTAVADHPSGRDPLASGPFTVASWTPDARLVLEPNERAPDDLSPHLDRIVFKVLPEYGTRLKELKLGTVDLVPGIDIEDLPEIQEETSLRTIQQNAAVVDYIGYNLDDPRFADPRVRRALTLGIDRERLIRDYLTLGGTSHGRYAIGTISPVHAKWHANDLVPLPYDPAGALELLDQAGWRDRDGDGVRERRGRDLRFTLLVQTGSTFQKRLAVLVQAYWESLGVAAEIEPLEPRPFAERVRTRDYQAMLWSFGADPKIDPGVRWHSEGPHNWFGYADPEVDRLIEQGRTTTDAAEAQEAVRQVQREVYADQPATFLYWKDQVAALDRRFEQVQMNPFTVLHAVEDWYVPAAEQKYRGIEPDAAPVQD